MADNAASLADLVVENAAAGSFTGIVAGANFPGDLPATYSLTDDAGGRFAIDAVTGAVTVKTGAAIDYETSGGQYKITVRAVAEKGPALEREFVIAVANVNDAPIANAGAAAGSEDSQIFGLLSGSDAENPNLIFALAAGPAHGAVVVNANGSFAYTPNADYNGTDSFTFTVSDGVLTSAPQSVALTVTPVNDAPVGTKSAATGAEDSGIAGKLVGGDIDSVGLTYALASGPAHGVVSVNANGNFAYTPNANYNGTDSFTFTVSDGKLTSTPQVVDLTLTAVNDAPVANAGAAAGSEDSQIFGLLSGSDVDNPSLIFALAAGPAHGSVVVNANGSFAYTPNADYNGADSFTFTVSDGVLTSAPQSVALTIAAVNEAPVALSDVAAVAEDQVLNGIAALDVEGDALSFNLLVAPLHGIVSFAGDGSYTYTPNANFNGKDSFFFQAMDSQGQVSGNAGIAINVAPVNDAPDAPVLNNPLAIFEKNGVVQTVGVGTLSANDIDGDVVSFSVDALFGDGALFTVQGNNLVFKGAADFEVKSSYQVRVNSSDNIAIPQESVFTIAVENQIDLVDLSPGTFGGQAGFIIQGDAAGDRLGRSPSFVGDINGDGFDDLAVGAHKGDDGGVDAGEAYIIFGTAGGFGAPTGGREVLDVTNLSPSEGFIIQGDAAVDQAGFEICLAGDINGDGFDDIIVGAIAGDDGGVDAGEAYVIFGTANGFGVNIGGRQVIDLAFLQPYQGFVIQGDAAGDFFGRLGGGSAGDINGDGFSDMIIGADSGDDGGANAGEAYVIFGSAAGFGSYDFATGRQVLDITNLSPSAGFIIQGDAAGDSSGYSLSNAGDINGDGLDDLIIGALFGDDGGVDAGEAYVVFGSKGSFGAIDPMTGRRVIDLTSLSPLEGFIIQGDSAGDRCGLGVGSVGDINGDGFIDLMVGANRGDDGGVDAGEAYIVFGAAGGFGTNIGGRRVIDLTKLTAAEGFIIQGDNPNDNVGRESSGAGDVNGDGFDDIVVCAYGNDGGGANAGKAYVIFGGNNGFGTATLFGGYTRQVIDLTSLSSSQGFFIQGDAAGDIAGIAAGVAGDINGDGFDDIVVGAAYGDDGGADAGEGYVIYGSAFGVPAIGLVKSGGLAAEQLVGGVGNNTISGGGGADVIRGGAGDDTIVVGNANFFRIDGGGGSDSLKFGYGGNIDFDSLHGRIEEIEAIDFGNGLANAVTLDLDDLLDLDVTNRDVAGSSASNTLLIESNQGEGDTLTLSGGNWQYGGMLSGYQVFFNLTYWDPVFVDTDFAGVTLS